MTLDPNRQARDHELSTILPMANRAVRAISKARVVILDFDGVIKDSLDAKADAFCSLFENTDPKTLEKIKTHHWLNGGISRSKKLPYYLELAGIPPSDSVLREKLDQLGKIMINKVLECEWVPYALQFISENRYNQNIYIASAAPKEELEEICNQSSISQYIKKIYGSNSTKQEALKDIMREEQCEPSSCVFVGDSLGDIKAANETMMQFILRQHQYNQALLKGFMGVSIPNFRPMMEMNTRNP